MKKFIKEFILRGALFCWGGPVIVCIVWACLKAAGVIEVLSVNTVVLGIISSLLMAFVAAGISVVNQLEQLPKPIAAIIQAAVLYIDYLALYLINNWMPAKVIWIFSLCFFLCFALIWLIVYLTTKKTVKKLNTEIAK